MNFGGWDYFIFGGGPEFKVIPWVGIVRGIRCGHQQALVVVGPPFTGAECVSGRYGVSSLVLWGWVRPFHGMFGKAERGVGSAADWIYFLRLGDCEKVLYYNFPCFSFFSSFLPFSFHCCRAYQDSTHYCHFSRGGSLSAAFVSPTLWEGGSGVGDFPVVVEAMRWVVVISVVRLWCVYPPFHPKSLEKRLRSAFKLF